MERDHNSDGWMDGWMDGILQRDILGGGLKRWGFQGKSLTRTLTRGRRSVPLPTMPGSRAVSSSEALRTLNRTWQVNVSNLRC